MKFVKNQFNKIKKAVLKNKLLSVGILGLVILFVLVAIKLGIIPAFALIILLIVIITAIKYFKMNKKKKKNMLKKILITGFMAGVAVLILIFGFVSWVIFTAPTFDAEAMNRQDASILYDATGKVYAKLGLEIREKITYEEMPEVLVDAIIATEDSRFFQHNGFDLPRFAKATFGQLTGSDAGGASTITMQVSKNNYTSKIATGIEGIKRKFTDIYMSIFQIERNYTKEEILEFYVNQPYLGSGSYGVEQAAKTYFGKSAKDLNLSEAAIIAGLFQAPGAYDPFVNPDAAAKRRSTVLYLMERHGYITGEERKIADAIPMEDLLTTKNETNEYQAFIDTVVEEVIATTGNDPYVVPMQIYTTMDAAKQLYIRDIMNGTTWKWENESVNAGIMVLDVKTGAIIAVGAGRNREGQRQFNNATMITRQIGSTAKPFYDYGPAIEYSNWSTYNLIVDEPYTYSDKKPVGNWDGKFEGLITTRQALVNSRNIPALKTFKQMNNASVLKFVQSLGLSPEISGGTIHEAHAIGGYTGESPLTMAAAFASYARGGYYVKPYSFTKIVYLDTNEVYETTTTKTKVMSEATAYMINSMLVDTARTYGNIKNVPYIAKTGTTNYSKETMAAFKMPSNAVNDLWTSGSSPDYAISVWYGYDRVSAQFYNRLGVRTQLTLFTKVAQGVFKTGTAFPTTNEVSSVAVEKESWPAMLPSANTPANMIVTELFKKGTEPTKISPRYENLKAPTNLEYGMSGDKVTLTWTPIATPDALDTAKLTTYFNSLYTNAEWKTAAITARDTYNTTNIGVVGYNIYSKAVDGTLTLLDFTQNTTYERNIYEDTTFVVKATYSIFKASLSQGIEQSVLANSNMVINMVGANPMNLALNAPYTESLVTVTLDGANITSSVTIDTVYKKEDGTVLTSIDTSVAGIYKVYYTITYNGFVTTKVRTVNIA